MRGIFFDEDEAREVERQLAADGYDVALSRVAYAGEDDDEDHPWAVTTDAPAVVLEILVDHHDGWLDDDTEAPAEAAYAPVDLPDSPKRHHRPPS
ncbi:hypothetical protein [Marmoricola sp. RAF53]|uniref:hypothetical protein n=1 Tax=Marmoricola sp. RAF53 TaxID=3233059 RepID=UPI003F96AC0A